tara:strand:- start:11690 stop:12241 length:552 start_codon:yes stop_codon:yes gene_type:complete
MPDFERIIDYPLDTDQRNELIGAAVTFGPDGQSINLSNFEFLKTKQFQGVNIQVPFRNDPSHGYFALNTNYFDAAATNISLLLNTLPTERVVTGVGCNVKRLLFEQRNDEWEEKLKGEIKAAVNVYMPQINISSILIAPETSLGNPRQINIEKNAEYTVNISIKFNFKVASEINQTANIQING